MKKKMIDLTKDNDDDSAAQVLCILSLLVLVAVHIALRGKEGKMFISTFWANNSTVGIMDRSSS